MEMRKFTREFRLEAVRLIKERSAACVPRPRSDEARATGDRAAQALKREVIRLRAERDVQKKPRPTSCRNRGEVRFHREAPGDLAGGMVVRGTRCLAGWVLSLADTSTQSAQPE